MELGRTRQLALGNIGALSSIESKTDINGFVQQLSLNCAKTKSVDKTNATDMCLLILSCNAYDFNSTTIRNLEKRYIESYWRAIDLSIASLVLFDTNLYK